MRDDQMIGAVPMKILLTNAPAHAARRSPASKGGKGPATE
jgi:hypothetical protein